MMTSFDPPKRNLGAPNLHPIEFTYGPIRRVSFVFLRSLGAEISWGGRIGPPHQLTFGKWPTSNRVNPISGGRKKVRNPAGGAPEAPL